MKLTEYISKKIKQNFNLMLTESDYKTFNGNKFEIDFYDYHSGQSNGKVNMRIGSKIVAHADIVSFKNKIYIQYIESHVKGKGYGSELMRFLASEYGYENLERSSLTQDGVKMRQRLDKEFNFSYDDYVKGQNKHIKIETVNKIKNPIIKHFLLDVIQYGYEKAWDKWMKIPKFVELKNKVDFNDIAYISEWVIGSVTNNNDPDELPDYITTELKAWL